MKLDTLYNAQEAREDLIANNEDYIRYCIQKIKQAVSDNKTIIRFTGERYKLVILESVLKELEYDYKKTDRLNIIDLDISLI
jgi:hypothetical protein